MSSSSRVSTTTNCPSGDSTNLPPSPCGKRTLDSPVARVQQPQIVGGKLENAFLADGELPCIHQELVRIWYPLIAMDSRHDLRTVIAHIHQIVDVQQHVGVCAVSISNPQFNRNVAQQACVGKLFSVTRKLSGHGDAEVRKFYVYKLGWRVDLLYNRIAHRTPRRAVFLRRYRNNQHGKA